MATLAEVEVAITARLEPLMRKSREAERHIIDLERKLEKAGRTGAIAFREANNEIGRLRSSVSRLAMAVGTGLGVREITQYADAWTNAGNKIRAAAEIAGVQTRSLEELNQMAIENRSSFEGTVDLYAKLIRTASGVAKSEQEIADATEAVTKAFKTAGATTQEQIAGIVQLGQALGSGILQGDELRSIRENAPIVAQAIANEFKTTVAGLKALGAEGKLTSDRIFKALLTALPEIRRAFDQTVPTIADSFTQLNNKVTEYIGKLFESVGASQALNQMMLALAGNIESVANAAAAAGLVLLGAFGGGSVLRIAASLLNPWVALAVAIGAAAYAVSEFWNEIVPLQGSFATLGDYAGAVWDIISEGALSAKETVVSAYETMISGIETAMSSVGVSFEDVGDVITSLFSTLWQTVKGFINNNIHAFIQMKDVVSAAFNTLPAAIASGVVTAMNTMISLVQAGLNKVIEGVNTAISAINSVAGFAGIEPIFSDIKPVDLGQIENNWAGAGEAAADAFGEIFNREVEDYVGNAGKAIIDATDKITNEITRRANERASARMELEREFNRASNFNGVNYGVSDEGYGKGVDLGEGAGGGGKGKKSRKEKESFLDKEIRQIKERTDALKAETEAQSQLNPLVNDYGYAVEFAKAKQELLNAAKRDGLTIDDDLISKIDELAKAYADAHVAAEILAEDQERLKSQVEDFKNLGKEVMGGFINDLKEGKSASEALANALNKVADKLMDIALDAMWGTGNFSGGTGGGGGLFGSLLSGIFGGFFAKGGNPPMNKVSVVGEKGPELFVPKVPGVVVPNHQLNPTIGNGVQTIDLRIELETDSSAIAGIAQTEIQNSAPGIIRVSVEQSSKMMEKNLGPAINNTKNRQL